MRPFLKILFFCIATYHLSAQIEFSKIPKYLQLFPRDSLNFGHLEVQGYSPFAGTIRTLVSEMTTSVVVESYSVQVKSYETFTVRHKIPACLKQYQLQVFLKEEGKTEHREKLVLGLLAGDFFIVDGQSNAECPSRESTRSHDSIYFNPFTRVIGSSYAVATALSEDQLYPVQSIARDCEFARPSSNSYFNGDFAFSGIWPIVLQCGLANATGIPNCFINGSQGSTAIRLHLASHTPSVADSLVHSSGPFYKPKAFIYDRMYKKIHANNAIKGVKGIFWYQGESDGNVPRDSSMSYEGNFKTLYTSWKADYPSLKKIFVLQLNLGCGGDYHNIVREIQRKLPEKYPDVAVMSTVGSPFSDRDPDACHYTIDGYTRIATKLLPLAKKWIYDFPLEDENILPANVQRIYYSAPNQLCIEFDKKIVVQDSCIYPEPNAGVAYLKDYFYQGLSTPIRVQSTYAEGNKLFLNLDINEKIINTLTYLPAIFTNVPSLYSGPWILTEANTELGAFAFTDFPVGKFRSEKSFVIFPNPATDTFTLYFKEEGIHNIWLYDAYGNLIFSTNISNGKEILKVEAWPAGIYILRARTPSGGIASSKIILK